MLVHSLRNFGIYDIDRIGENWKVYVKANIRDINSIFFRG